jgi:predicted N-acetyltransferase YhbS
MNGMVIREASAEEPPAILAVMQVAYTEYQGVLDPPSGVHRETLRSLREQLAASHILAARVENALVGCVLYRAESDHLCLGRLAVRPEFRNRGLGAALVNFVEDRARELSVHRVRLGVRFVLRDLRSWYERLGYAVVAEGMHEGYDRPTFVIVT